MSYFGVSTSGYILHATNDKALFGFGELRGDASGILGDNRVTRLQGRPISSTAPNSSDFIQWNGSEFIYTAAASSNHNILSSTHTDTQPEAVTRGAIIYGSGASPKWARMPLGSQGFVIYSDGTDITYTRLGAVTPFSLGTVGAPSFTFTGDTNTGMSAANADVLVFSAGASGLMRLDGVNNYVALDGGHVHKVTLSTGNYTLTSADYAVIVSALFSNSVTLPTSPMNGQTFVIKDGSGNAQSNNITINGNGKTIDGNSTILLRNNYASFTLSYNGTQWSVL